ncbi:MAG: tripartite tricarboxylate transporter substrate binding protein [Burkholderiales bacterium]|nr:tripartite tricarboxylate transporter substrate binding protein [Burkholderiales bacterium]
MKPHHNSPLCVFALSRRNVLQVAVTSAAAWVMPAKAQATWPAKPVTMVVPFPAGGGTDAFARPLSAQFSRLTGKTLVIDNKGGAGGTLGAGVAAKAVPDGYTLFMGAVHHTIAPAMYPKLDYDLERDLVPLIQVASVPQVLVINPRNLPVADFKAFMAHVRKYPGKLNYGSAGGGTSHHLAGELFKLQTQAFITHIPYRGAGPALQDLIAGNVDMMFDGLGSSAAHIKGGRIKALMVSGPKRSPAFPDVPCSAELGLPDYNVTTWYGVWAPRGTPVDAQTRAVEEIRKACQTDEARAVWASQGAEFPNLTGPQFAAFIRAELAKWAHVVSGSGAKLD